MNSLTDIEVFSGGEMVVYEAPGGAARLEQETVRLTQRQMADVFDTTPENVLMHLPSVFSNEELEAEATTREGLNKSVTL